MTEKERLEEVRKNIEEVLVKARQARVKSNGIANFILYALSQEDITDQILSIKADNYTLEELIKLAIRASEPDANGLGIISDDNIISLDREWHNDWGGESGKAGYELAIKDMLASNFRRVIIVEESNE